MSGWRESALCAQADPESFFPTDDKEGFAQAKEALAICGRCPVVTECWWDQITSDEEPWGIRGGRKPSELKASRKAYERGGDERHQVEAELAAKDRKEAERVAYLEGRTDRQREASRKYAAAKRAREREERQTAWEVPDQRQPERAGDVAEVA